jgi:hypothetical protein
VIAQENASCLVNTTVLLVALQQTELLYNWCAIGRQTHTNSSAKPQRGRWPTASQLTIQKTVSPDCMLIQQSIMHSHIVLRRSMLLTMPWVDPCWLCYKEGLEV